MFGLDTITTRAEAVIGPCQYERAGDQAEQTQRDGYPPRPGESTYLFRRHDVLTREAANESATLAGEAQPAPTYPKGRQGQDPAIPLPLGGGILERRWMLSESRPGSRPSPQVGSLGQARLRGGA